MILDKNKIKAIRLLVFTDKTKKEVAKEVGITEQTLYNWLKDDEFNNFLTQTNKVYYGYIRKRTFKALNKLLLKAFEVIEKALNSNNEHIKIKSAFQILTLYQNFFETKWLGNVHNELADIIEKSRDVFVDDVRISANEFLKSKELDELLDFEEEKQDLEGSK